MRLKGCRKLRTWYHTHSLRAWTGRGSRAKRWHHPLYLLWVSVLATWEPQETVSEKQRWFGVDRKWFWGQRKCYQFSCSYVLAATGSGLWGQTTGNGFIGSANDVCITSPAKPHQLWPHPRAGGDDSGAQPSAQEAVPPQQKSEWSH